MRTLPRVSNHLILEKTDTMDLQIASLVWGITLGIGFLTTWKAIKQATSITRRYGYCKLNSPYVWMMGSQIISCLVFSLLSWLYLNAYIKPRYEVLLHVAHSQPDIRISVMFFFIIRKSLHANINFNYSLNLFKSHLAHCRYICSSRFSSTGSRFSL